MKILGFRHHFQHGLPSLRKLFASRNFGQCLLPRLISLSIFFVERYHCCPLRRLARCLVDSIIDNIESKHAKDEYDQGGFRVQCGASRTPLFGKTSRLRMPVACFSYFIYSNIQMSSVAAEEIVAASLSLGLIWAGLHARVSQFPLLRCYACQLSLKSSDDCYQAARTGRRTAALTSFHAGHQTLSPLRPPLHICLVFTRALDTRDRAAMNTSSQIP